MRLAFKNDPDITVISTEASMVFSITSTTINCMAMTSLLKKYRNWNLAKTQMPPSTHIAFTACTADHWKDLVDSIKFCIKMMKADKSLNSNETTATYGMTGLVPDKSFLRKFICLHQQAMLDTL
jgi:hypothetical protein